MRTFQVNIRNAAYLLVANFFFSAEKKLCCLLVNFVDTIMVSTLSGVIK